MLLSEDYKKRIKQLAGIKLIKEKVDLLQYPEWVERNIELDGDDIILYHWGTDGGTGFLDPKFFGKNPYTSDVKQWTKKRVMFYTKESDKEHRVNGEKYVIKYPLENLYVFNSDKLHFFEKCMQKLNKTEQQLKASIPEQLSCISDEAEKNGFKGFILRWDDDKVRVDIWEKIDLNRYQINKEEDNNNQLEESGFARVRRIMNANVDSIDSVGIISAENPMGQKFSNEENNIRTEELKQKIRNLKCNNINCGFILIKGKYGAWENSFIIPNINKNDLIELGKIFEQESIIYGEKNISDDKFGKLKYFNFEYIENGNTIETKTVSFTTGNVQSKKDFFSLVKGRKFIIPFFEKKKNKIKRKHKIPHISYGTKFN